MANKVFSNTNLCGVIATYLDTHAQDICKGVNSRLNEDIKGLQRRNLFRLIPDEIYKTVGEERMRRVPIMNLYGARICLNDLRESHLPGSIVIGQDFVKNGQDPILFIAYKVHYVAEGRCCGSMVVKKSAGAIFSARWRRWEPAGDSAPLNGLPVNPTSLGQLKKFFNGVRFERLLIDEDRQESCACLSSLLRNCFFVTNTEKYPYQMVLGD